jgi:hypothetical protein
MYVVVQIRPLADLDSSETSSRIPGDLQELSHRLGIELKPLHVGTQDPTLARYLYVEVPNQQMAEQIIARLQSCNSVEAAYLKLPEAPPSP